MEGDSEFGIHWYAFTTRTGVVEIIKVLTPLLCPKMDADEYEMAWQLVPGGRYMYRRRMLGPGGAWILYSEGRDDVHVELPGTACECMGVVGVLALISAELQQIPKRIDFAFDGVRGPDGKQLSPSWVHERCRACPDEIRTRANIRPDMSKPPEQRTKSPEFNSNAQGSTCYIGSAASDRRLRIYDRRGPTRIELQLRNQRAADAWMCLEGKKSTFRAKRTALSLLRDFIDFVIPEGKNPSRFECQPWWTEFCEEVETMRIAHPVPATTLEQKCQYIATQVASTLSLLADKFQEASIDDDGVMLLTRGEIWTELGKLIDALPRSASSKIAAAVNRQLFSLYDAERAFTFALSGSIEMGEGFAKTPFGEQAEDLEGERASA